MQAKKISNQNGMVAVITLLGVSTVALGIITSLAVLSMSELKMSKSGGSLEQTFYSAEAGLNEALYRLISKPEADDYSFTFNNANVVISVVYNPDNPYQRIIRSMATDPDGKVRNLEIIANTDSYAGGFDYAVQGGSGGVFLSNNSTIIGDLYTNSSVQPVNPGDSGFIQGSAWLSGNNEIKKAIVTQDVHAHTIVRNTIAGQAYYQNIDTQTEVGGLNCPNTGCHPGSTDPEPKPFPLGDSDVTKWKDDINDMGHVTLTVNPTVCPTAHNSGFYCVVSDQTLGYDKIEGNLYLGNGAKLTLNGNLWVTGNIILDNNGTIEVDPSIGPGSVVIISDGRIDINNNYTIRGSGDPHSFVLVLSMSTKSDESDPAIYAANNSASIIFASLHGMLKVKNNGSLNATCADKLYLMQNSSVTFNPLLSAFYIPNGGGNNVGTALGTWREL